MKMLEVVIKLAFFVFKNCKFFPIFCKMIAKNQFFGIILKVHLIKRESVFKKLNHISFVTWTVFYIFFAHEKIELSKFFVHLFAQIGLRTRIMCLKIDVFLKISKESKNE